MHVPALTPIADHVVGYASQYLSLASEHVARSVALAAGYVDEYAPYAKQIEQDEYAAIICAVLPALALLWTLIEVVLCCGSTSGRKVVPTAEPISKPSGKPPGCRSPVQKSAPPKPIGKLLPTSGGRLGAKPTKSRGSSAYKA